MLFQGRVPTLRCTRCLVILVVAVGGLLWSFDSPLRRDSILPFSDKSDHQNPDNKENNDGRKFLQQSVICRNKIKQVAFVKVHKAGSTTVMNIFERFAYQRDLFIALPLKHNIIYEFNSLVSPPPGGQFDMLINHVTQYNREAFEKVLKNNTKYIGIIREPLDLTVSAFEYYHTQYGLYQYIPGTDKLKTYMSNREKYEYENVARSYTNNRMSHDFGLDRKYFHDVDKINQFLVRLDFEMDLVMILEKLTESLILLKKKFCWQLKDILYVTRNKNEKKRELTFTAEELVYHWNFSLADNMLYDYFTNRFQQQLNEFDQDSFKKEVLVFKSLITKVSDYCQEVEQNKFVLGQIPLLVLEASPFNYRFNVTVEDCRLMTYDELTFCDFSRSLQENLLRKLKIS